MTLKLPHLPRDGDLSIFLFRLTGGESFSIQNGNLVLKKQLPAGEYPLTIRCADWGAAFTDANFTIRLTP